MSINKYGFVEINSTDIINRAKDALNLKRDTDLADLLNISHGTIHAWKKRNNIDLNTLLTKMAGINVHWLVTGEGQSTFDEPEPVGNHLNNLVNDQEKTYGALTDPLAIIEKLKRLDPAHLKTILELIDLYSKRKEGEK